MSNLDYQQVETVLVDWLTQRVEEAGAEGAVVGLSGGIDSSVVSVLCKKAFGQDVTGIIMPCYSEEQDANDAEKVAGIFEIDYIIHDLSSVFEGLLALYKEDESSKRSKLAAVNIKPRLRMITLYYYASLKNYLVIGTDNWSELKVGYFTKHGDGGVDLAPLGRLVKTEVRELAGHLGIPDSIIEKPPSAGLWQDQTDEEEMGLTYETLDRYILTGEVDPENRKQIEELTKKNAHKLEPIPVPARDSFTE
ncbi:MAG: NAD(+) synthase [Halanaerobiales bacterium]